jgi:hypothetical protein
MAKDIVRNAASKHFCMRGIITAPEAHRKRKMVFPGEKTPAGRQFYSGPAITPHGLRLQLWRGH